LILRCSVLTISDSTHAGVRHDVSGPAVAARLAQAGHAIILRAVLPDEREQIAAKLKELAGTGDCDAIFTTGGTGLSVRDVTPEATLSVVEREIPGFGELMRAEGLKTTRRAALSRSTAGTLLRTVIVNLPGSPKGAVESLNAILDLVPHVVELLQGRTQHSLERGPGGETEVSRKTSSKLDRCD
jgi:molybdopterin adenylyltransferase